ncbi:hypothetical protein OH807_24355 [Kitasatospora sp. NBC_01560]|uniref:hypothetical protein n=1 Tax=Kitasatospora sp. NBC_01560 TaxID=2975965 RepID=UPI0038639E3B
MSGQYPGQFGPPSGGAFPGGAPLDGPADAGGYGAPHPVGPQFGQPSFEQPRFGPAEYAQPEFGPPRYGPPYPAQPHPAAGPYPVPPTQPLAALRPGAAAGPFGLLGRILWSLVPLLTVGLLGMIPSLLLAIRRRRAYDIAGAVLFAGLFLTYLVCAGVAGGTKNAPTADTVGMVAMVLMWFGAPLHFLAMDLRAVWDAGRPKAPAPAPAAAYYPPPGAAAGPVAGYPPAAAGPSYGAAPGYAPAAGPATPAPGAGPGPAPAPATGDELRELGELLRRQAREGGRP